MVCQVIFKKACIDYIKSFNPNAIILGEMLVGGEYDRIRAQENSGYTNLTNDVLFVKADHVRSRNYGWICNSIEVKRTICKSAAPGFRTGTIGATGSHDDGTALLLGCRVKRSPMES